MERERRGEESQGGHYSLSAHRDGSPTWGSWGSGIAFLSLLSWKLVETCQEQQRDATSALQHLSPSYL